MRKEEVYVYIRPYIISTNATVTCNVFHSLLSLGVLSLSSALFSLYVITIFVLQVVSFEQYLSVDLSRIYKLP